MDGVKIPSIDAKDLYIANHMREPNPQGYSLVDKNGEMRISKYINTLDYSLDLIKLREVYTKVYRNRKFSRKLGDMEYTSRVINVTFKYSNKEFNRVGKNTFLKFGHTLPPNSIQDGSYVKDGELIAIQVGIPIENPLPPEILGKAFVVKDGKYKPKNNSTLNTVAELRYDLYKNGFTCDGIHYVRFKRSSGSSRVGKCLFIDEALYSRMHKWEMMGIKIRDGDPVDLAALEAYISLTLSSIIDTIQIKPWNILVVDDYESVFNDDVIATTVKDGWLHTTESVVPIKNSIWDGQSLIDPSLMGDYSRYGMILLRTNFFKSCCFNSNIQDYFRDHGITSVDQLNGFTLAEDIEDVKLITTPSSIKYVKFGDIKTWLSLLDGTFGVVKHEKKTHYQGGRMVQTHYQLLNTLQLSEEDVHEFLRPSIEYMNLLKTEPAVLRYQIHYPEDHDLKKAALKDKQEITYQLMGLNNRFTQTKWYSDFYHSLITAYKNNIRKGHVLVEGNYSTLLGNPIEMLQQSIGSFSGESVLGIGNVHTKRFPYGTRILGSRSPHVAVGNILLTNNVACEEIDKYINQTEEIICINSIGENILQRLSGADFDSDTLLITDHPLLIQAAEKNYHRFGVPTNLVESRKTKRFYTPEQQADLDIKTSVNKIGDIINLSQELQTNLWHQLNNGADFEEVRELYYDICQLDVMSGCEIDSAKKEFAMSNVGELQRLKKKWLRKYDQDRVLKPYFFEHLVKAKGYKISEKKAYTKHDTTMDFLAKEIDRYKSPRVKSENLPIISIIDFPDYDSRRVYYEQEEKILELVKNFREKSNALWNLKSDYDPGEKYDLYQKYKAEVYGTLKKMKINKHTLYHLIKSTESGKYSGLVGYVIILLFNLENEDAYDLLTSNREFIDVLAPDPQGEIILYGKTYSKKPSNLRNIIIEPS